MEYGWEFSITGVLTKRQNLDPDTYADRENTKMKAEIYWIIRKMTFPKTQYDKPRDSKNYQETTRSWEEGTEQILS